MTKHKHLWLFALGLSFALVVFYFPFLTNQNCFYLSDASLYFEPLCHHLAESFQQLKIPMWNPLVYCGTPQIAIVSPGIFYPPNWLFGMLPFSPALAIHLILHQLVAGVGAYLLVFGLGWGVEAACIGGITYALCGYMFSLQSNFTLVETACWLPLALWSTNNIKSVVQSKTPRKTYRSLMASTLVIFLLITSGRPEISEPSILLILGSIAISFARGLKADWKGSFRIAILQLVAIALGVLFAAPMLLPALEWKSLSAREQGLRPDEIFLWSSNWYDLVCLILAQPLGDLNLLGTKYLNFIATRPGFIPYVSSAFVGPVAMSLALFGLCDKNFRARTLVLALLVASLAMAIGSYSPIAPWVIKTMPLLAIYRYPVKLLIFAVLCLAIFAARGISLILSEKVGIKSQVFCLAFWSAILVPAIVLLTPRGAHAFASHMYRAQTVNYAVEALRHIARGALVACIIGISICLLTQLFLKHKLHKTAYATIVISSLVASLMSAAFLFDRHLAQSSFYTTNSYLQKICVKLVDLPNENEGPSYTAGQSIRSRILPLYFDPLSCPEWYQGTGAFATSKWYQYCRQLLLPNTNMDFDLPSSFGYEAAETRDYRRLYFGVLKRSNAWVKNIGSTSTEPSAWQKTDLPLARFCQMTATQYAFTQVFNSQSEDLPKLDDSLFDLVQEDRKMNVRIWQVKETLPRAYFSDSWIWSSSHNDVLNKMMYADQSGFDPKINLLLEHVNAKSDPRTSASHRNKRALSQLAFVDDLSEHVLIYARTNVPGFLVLADHYYPGWQVSVDHRPTKIFKANGLLRAVFLPPGAHMVEFSYHPLSLYRGYLLAWFALALALGLGLTRVLLRTFVPKP